MTCIIPVVSPAPTLSAPFYRTRGDDWRGQQALAFQYGQFVPTLDANGAPILNAQGKPTGTVIGYDITGWSPVGRFLKLPLPVVPPFDDQPPQALPSPVPDCTVANGFAALTDPKNGRFVICPDRTVTSQFPAQWFNTLPDTAALLLSVKLYDNSNPPNLGTVTTAPIIVTYG